MGVINLESNQASDYQIESFTVHENYKVTTKQNDIALIKLEKDVSLRDPKKIRPACLWQSNNIDQTDTVATGWGALSYGGSSTKNLMKVLLPILDMDVCVNNFEDDDITFSGNQICAGVLAGGRDTCQGGKATKCCKTFY